MAFDAFSPGHGFDHPFIGSSPEFTPRNGSLRRRPIGDMSLTANMSFRDRSKRLLDVETEKNQLIEDLLYHLDITEKLLDQTRLDHNRESHYNRENQLRENKLHEQMRQVKELMSRDPFIILLIDGDSNVFSDELLRKGEKGGKEAARMLASAAADFVSQTLPHLNGPKVIARIYANVRGLAESLCMKGIIDKSTVLEDFICGFNGGKLLFDFIDAGSRKDAAGDKIGEIYKLYLHDCHCHQIVFGCGNHPDYAQLLEDAICDPQLTDHITVLETVPYEGEIALVKSNFRCTKFENLFRTNKLAQFTAPVLKPLQTVQATLPTLKRVESNGTNGTNGTNNTSVSSTPVMTWASMTAAPFIPSSTSRAGTPSTKSSEPVLPAVVKCIPGVERNRQGQRIDKFDPTIARDEIQRIKKLKLCNIFYLQGADACTNLNCSHDHNYRLTAKEKKTLGEVARMTPCFYQTECDDPGCIYGHRCPQSKPNEKECWYKEDCRFWGWGHGIDTRIVKTTRV